MLLDSASVYELGDLQVVISRYTTVSTLDVDKIYCISVYGRETRLVMSF